jgi:hypothetical protein
MGGSCGPGRVSHKDRKPGKQLHGASMAGKSVRAHSVAAGVRLEAYCDKASNTGRWVLASTHGTVRHGMLLLSTTCTQRRRAAAVAVP